MKKVLTPRIKLDAKKIILIMTSVLFLAACEKRVEESNSVDCSGPSKSFSVDVSPVVQASCALNSGCHGTGSANGPGALLNYDAVFAARSDIRPAVASGHMPLNGTLTATEKAAIVCWIDGGAPNN